MATEPPQTQWVRLDLPKSRVAPPVPQPSTAPVTPTPVAAPPAGAPGAPFAHFQAAPETAELRREGVARGQLAALSVLLGILAIAAVATVFLLLIVFL